MRLRAASLALALALALAGCPDSSAPAPGIAPPTSAATPARPPRRHPVIAPPETAPAPAPAPAPPEEPAPRYGDDQLPPLLDHPDGVPFPLPDPLPPECTPRAPVDPPPPQEGPAPLLYWVGGTGEGDGRFVYPRALVAAPDGRSVVVVDKTGRLQRFDHDGRLLRLVRTPAIAQGKPTGLGVDQDGQVYVADTHYSRVLVYGPEFDLRHAWGAPGRAPGLFMFISSVKPAPDGRVWTTDYGDEVARAQAFEATSGVGSRPLIAVGTFGTGTSELRRPMSLCFDPERPDVYVADAVNHRVVVLGRDGAWKRTLSGPGREPGQLDFPYDVVQDERGRLWIAEFGNQRVTVLDRDTGRCLGTWGEAGRRVGAIARPWGVALGADDRVWVLDSQNDRLYALPRASVLAP